MELAKNRTSVRNLSPSPHSNSSIPLVSLLSGDPASVKVDPEIRQATMANISRVKVSSLLSSDSTDEHEHETKVAQKIILPTQKVVAKAASDPVPGILVARTSSPVSALPKTNNTALNRSQSTLSPLNSIKTASGEGKTAALAGKTASLSSISSKPAVKRTAAKKENGSVKKTKPESSKKKDAIQTETKPVAKATSARKPAKPRESRAKKSEKETKASKIIIEDMQNSKKAPEEAPVTVAGEETKVEVKVGDLKKAGKASENKKEAKSSEAKKNSKSNDIKKDLKPSEAKKDAVATPKLKEIKVKEVKSIPKEDPKVETKTTKKSATGSKKKDSTPQPQKKATVDSKPIQGSPRKLLPTAPLKLPSLLDSLDETKNPDDQEEPVILIDVPLYPAESNNYLDENGQVVFNFYKLVNDKFGQPAKAKRNLITELHGGEEEEDDVVEVEDDDGVEEEEDDDVDLDEKNSSTAAASSSSKKKSHPMKGRSLIGKYDTEDPFIDDSELLWEEQRVATKDGFFVYFGPLIEKGQYASFERVNGTMKRGGIKYSK